MNAGRLTISVVLTCAFLWGCASADTPAPEPAAALPPPSAAEKAFLEDNPARLKTFTCPTLDDAMASNYGLACVLETSASAVDKTIGEQAVLKFKAQQKEYKSRCKEAPAKLVEAKKSRGNRGCKSLPGA